MKSHDFKPAADLKKAAEFGFKKIDERKRTYTYENDITNHHYDVDFVEMVIATSPKTYHAANRHAFSDAYPNIDING